MNFDEHYNGTPISTKYKQPYAEILGELRYLANSKGFEIYRIENRLAQASRAPTEIKFQNP